MSIKCCKKVSANTKCFGCYNGTLEINIVFPKCSRIFQLCKQELSPESTGLHPLCPTTWTIQTKALNYLLGNYSALTQALQQISEESHDDNGRRTNAILSQLQRFDTFFGIKLPYLVFSATEQTSINLPKDTSVL